MTSQTSLGQSSRKVLINVGVLKNTSNLEHPMENHYIKEYGTVVTLPRGGYYSEK